MYPVTAKKLLSGINIIVRICRNMDKHKEKEILLERYGLLQLPQGVINMAESSAELLNSVYREVSEKLGMDTALEIYRMFKGQQISFPVRFFNPVMIQKAIIEEYDGTNVRLLAIKYDYSEKTIRRIIKDSVESTDSK